MTVVKGTYSDEMPDEEYNYYNTLIERILQNVGVEKSTFQFDEVGKEKAPDCRALYLKNNKHIQVMIKIQPLRHRMSYEIYIKIGYSKNKKHIHTYSYSKGIMLIQIDGCGREYSDLAINDAFTPDVEKMYASLHQRTARTITNTQIATWNFMN